jgi:hypothetical protein
MKGQITIVAILVAFVSLMVLAIMAPLFATATSLIVNNTAGSGDQTSGLLAQFIFPALLIALMISIFGYASFARQQQPGY